ncbi:MAG: tRNA pseudouridine(38-40) synthase TruA [Pseudomonadota bacterium]
MPRYRVTLEYDGTPYCGYQRQKNGPSVQGALEQAVHRCTREQVNIGAAGRTDTGVHALGQVAQIDLERPWDEGKLFRAINALLKEAGEPVAVLDLAEAEQGWDARFSATARHYRYRILTRVPAPTIDANRVWWVRRGLDVSAMADAAQELIGHHDFTTFRSTDCQSKSPEKTLDVLDVERHGDEVHVTASARSFLHNQVRSLVGTLKMVGAGRWTRQDVARALAAKDRKAGGPVAPSCGLYFERVDYGSGDPT